jgi:hypothetical protein
MIATNTCFSGSFFKKQHRRQIAEQQLYRQGDHGEDHGVQQRLPQPRIVQRALKAQILAGQRDVLERGDDQLDQRIKPDQQIDEHRGRDQQVFECRVPVREPHCRMRPHVRLNWVWSKGG